MPEIQAKLDSFRAAHTQVLGISVDSIHSHLNWGRDLGGVSFPLLSDFEPKGKVAKEFGAYLDGGGITDRATVIIDRAGKVRYAKSVTPGGKRDIDALLAAAQEIDQANGDAEQVLPDAAPLPKDSIVFVKSHCGPSRRVRVAMDNLGLTDIVQTSNITEDSAALERLKKETGKDTAPCLFVDGKPQWEAADIIATLANRAAPVR